VPSHACQLGDEPGAFFESPEAEIEYEVCVTFPSAETLCSGEELAEEEVLYVNQITSDLPGTHLVTLVCRRRRSRFLELPDRRPSRADAGPRCLLR
jgi:hypothetical protein